MAYQTIKLSDYQAFNSVMEMNHHVRQFNKELSKKHYQTFNLIAQYSCKVAGVSHIKMETLAKKLNKSISTIKRHIKYLSDNHFISIINTSRIKSGGKGANIYVINSVNHRTEMLSKNNELSKMSYCNQEKKDGKTLSQQALEYVKIKKETIFFKALKKSLNVTGKRRYQSFLKRIDNIKRFRACPENVPEYIYKINAPFFTDKQISSLYAIILKQFDEGILDMEEINEIAASTFKALVKAMRDHYKYGKNPVENIFAYTRKIARKKMVDSVENKFYKKIYENDFEVYVNNNIQEMMSNK